MKHSIYLNAFRSYPALQLSLSSRYNCFVGPNGIGKTNLLEALSLFSPGRGLRRANLQMLQHQHIMIPWSVKAHFETDSGNLTLQTFMQTESSKRKIIVNEASLKTQTDLSNWITVSWLTPAMDRLFIEGWTERRRFLDRIVYTLYPEYALSLLRYNKALKERNQLLLSTFFEKKWCEGLEKILAQESRYILQWRKKALALLENESFSHITKFPPLHFKLCGEIETFFFENPDAFITRFLEKFDQTRHIDQYKGSTQLGIHKTRFEVFHPNTHEATFCSTGEQKALLISLIISLSRISIALYPECLSLLLMDEICAHLDEQKRGMLFNELFSLNAYLYLTGTDAEIFSPLKEKAKLYVIKEDGKIIQK